MAFQPKQTPLPGQPVARRKPYVYATWLAKQLGGNRCRWSVWFMAHYRHFKIENDAESLQEWNRNHTELMEQRQAQLVADGWEVFVEDDNSWTIEGDAVDVAGKPDLIAFKGGDVLVVDGKTGRERQSDIWQVLIYLWSLPRTRHDIKGKNIEGEVFYSSGREPVALAASDVTDAKVAEIVNLIEVVSSSQEPARVPSEYECRRCTIGAKDCPQRYKAPARGRGAVAAGF